MKGKMMILALTAALLVGLVPPSSAYANATEDDAFVEACLKLTDDEELFEKLKARPYVIGKTNDRTCDYMLMLYKDSPEETACVVVKGLSNYGKKYLAGFRADGLRANGECYEYNDGVWTRIGSNNAPYEGTSASYPVILASSFSVIYDVSDNVLYEDVPTLFDYTQGYNFGAWCKDAGLNCQASSNESTGVVPYSYNEYWHIVRKTSNGKWLLTTIGNSVMADNEGSYSLGVAENGNLQLISIYGGEDENGYKMNVRQYEYDTDGWKVRTYDAYDFRDSQIVDLGAGSGLDDTRLLAYNSVDIMGQSGAVLYPASTEYYEVTTTPPTEEPEEPESTVTPTPAPSGGNSAVGLTYTIKADNTPVHNSYWKDLSEVIGYLNMGDKVQIIGSKEVVGEIEPWYQVRASVDGQTVEGWVYGAYVNIESDLTFNGSDGLLDALNSVVGLISAVPLMLGAVFGFLPSWCLVILGASFAFMGVYLVVKLIRG